MQENADWETIFNGAPTEKAIQEHSNIGPR